MYEFVLINLYTKIIRIGTNVIRCEFILVNLYTKISEKKDLHPVGISTRDQYPRLKSSRSAIHHPALSFSGHFIYRRIGNKNTIRKTRHVQIHPCDIVIPIRKISMYDNNRYLAKPLSACCRGKVNAEQTAMQSPVLESTIQFQLCFGATRRKAPRRSRTMIWSPP
jgi:hypothetical protein